MFPIIMGVTLAFMITAGISGYYMVNKLFFNSSMNSYEDLEVHSFVDSTYTEEEIEADKAVNTMSLQDLLDDIHNM